MTRKNNFRPEEQYPHFVLSIVRIGVVIDLGQMLRSFSFSVRVLTVLRFFLGARSIPNRRSHLCLRRHAAKPKDFELVLESQCMIPISELTFEGARVSPLTAELSFLR